MKTREESNDSSVVVLTGGIGGTKLVLGLSHIIAGSRLTAIVNTGDDFVHLGLSICPDLDTLIYTLAGEVNQETGWGCRDETWQFMAALERLGGATWFRIGDRDLATHIMRSNLLSAGETLTDVTGTLRRKLGVRTRVLPMTDSPVRTTVVTDDGRLDFQHYFVRDRAEPVVRAIDYVGARSAEPSAAVAAALSDPDLGAIIIAPSNPYLSIDPILAVPGLREAVRNAAAPIIAVAPIVAGKAIKGPTAKIMRELAIEPSSAAVAEHYGDLLDGYIVDRQDRNTVSGMEKLDLRLRICDTIMQSNDDKIRLARDTLEFASSLVAENTEQKIDR